MSSRSISMEAIAGKAAKAVILYDHFETLLVANQLVGCLPIPSGGPEWTVNSWRFDLLEQGHEGETALSETSDAGLMIVAIRDAQALQYWPEEWLVGWAECHRQEAVALGLVLVGSANRTEAGAAIIAPLRRLADTFGLRFFIVDDASTPEIRAFQPERCHVNCFPVSQRFPELVQQAT